MDNFTLSHYSFSAFTLVFYLTDKRKHESVISLVLFYLRRSDAVIRPGNL